MRVPQQPGFVLHQRSYSETSLLLEIFTPHHGRLGLLAKGARRAASRLRGVLKPFQPLLLSWSGRGELPVLTQAEPQEATLALEGPTLYCGFYVNELLLRLLHRHDPHEQLYESYAACLARLDPRASNEATLRVFEKSLLREIGYGLVLDRDIRDNNPIAPQSLYDYILDRGPVRLDPQRDAPGEGVLLRGTSLIALAQERLEDEEALRDAKALMRAALARHLGGKPLASRRLYRQMAVARAPQRQEGLRD